MTANIKLMPMLVGNAGAAALVLPWSGGGTGGTVCALCSYQNQISKQALGITAGVIILVFSFRTG